MKKTNHFWLMKSEPNTFGIDHLRACSKQQDHWDGIRNYQVRNMLRDDFQPGDEAFFYHSNCKIPGIVGTMTVVSAPYPDHTAFDPESPYYDPKSDPENPRWYMVDVKFKEKFNDIVKLEQLRTIPALKEMLILRKGNRLSITPVTLKQWQIIHELSQ